MNQFFKKGLSLLCINLFSLVAASAMAEETSGSSIAEGLDIFQFKAGVKSRYDDNLFRQSSGLEQSDVINSVSLGVSVDAQYSLQTIRINAGITHNKYRTNDQLDWDRKQYGASWSWAITPRLKGTLSANRSEQVINFNDILITSTNPNTVQQIIQSNRNESFLFDYNVFGGWHVRGGASQQRQQNSQTFEQNPTYTTRSVDLGVQYNFRSGSTLTVMNHTRRGENDDRNITANDFDNEFKENETELVLNWLLTAKSKVRTTLGYYKREHDRLSVWDFSGFQGGVAYQWTPTGKLSVNVNLASNLGVFQSGFQAIPGDPSSFTIDNTNTRTTILSIRPNYQYSSKISFNGNLSYSKRKFEGDENSLTNASTARSEDKLYSYGLGMNWKPSRNATVGLNLSSQKNDSNNDLFDYKAKAATISGNISF